MRPAGELAQLALAGVVPSLAYLALGLALVRALRVPARGAERLGLAYAAGTGVASLTILALRAADVPIPLWALALVALVGALAARGGAPGIAASDAPRPAWARAIDAASVCVGLLLFAAALAPETTWDGFEYHLPLARAWAEGPIRALPGMLDAEFRAGVDLLYIPAVAAGFPDAAAAVSACFAASLAALVRAEAGRRASPAAGSIAGLFALLVPFTVDAAPSTYVDLAVGAYGFLALSFADRWNRSGETRWLPLAAAFVGFAANAKLHAAALAPAALAIALLGGRRPPPRALAACAGIAGLLVLPWLVKTAMTAGNPFFPFFGAWLGTGPATAEHLAWKRGDVYYYVRVDRDVAGFARYLASLTFGRTYHVSGLLGPLPLALAPLAWRRPSRPALALSCTLAALFALQFVFMPALRFGSPLLPFLAVASAVGGVRLARSGAAGRAAVATAVALLVAVEAAAALRALGPRVLALRDPDAYEREVLPDQVALREVVARAEPVVAIPRGAVSWMERPVYNLHWSRNGELFFDARTSPDAALALLERRGVRSLVLDVETPLPGDGTLGHPIVDAWLRTGRARVVPDADPPAARGGRIWVLVELE